MTGNRPRALARPQPAERGLSPRITQIDADNRAAGPAVSRRLVRRSFTRRRKLHAKAEGPALPIDGQTVGLGLRPDRVQCWVLRDLTCGAA